MTLLEAAEEKEYIIKAIDTDDEELNAFLFSLGCYSGEPVTVVSRKKKNLVICAEHLTYAYEDDDSQDAPPAVNDVSFSIAKGEYVAILGHNGSGKSTLAKLCNMILTPTEGKLFVLGKDVTDENFSEEDMYDLRSEIGMVFQNPDNQLVATVVDP